MRNPFYDQTTGLFKCDMEPAEFKRRQTVWYLGRQFNITGGREMPWGYIAVIGRETENAR
jgi:hypothetical protein